MSSAPPEPLEDRDITEYLNDLAESTDLVEVSAYADLQRARSAARGRRRRQRTAVIGAAAAAVVAIVAAGSIVDLNSDRSGPADQGVTSTPSGPTPMQGTDEPSETTAPPPTPSYGAEDALVLELARTVFDPKGEHIGSVGYSTSPVYDATGRLRMINTVLGWRSGERVGGVEIRLANADDPVSENPVSMDCSGCTEYPLQGSTVRVGTNDGGQPVRIYEQRDGDWVGLTFDAAGRDAIDRDRIDRFLAHPDLDVPDLRQPAEQVWWNTLETLALDHLSVTNDDSFRSLETEASPSDPFLAGFTTGTRSKDIGYFRIEGFKNADAPDGCPATYSRCEERMVDGTTISYRWMADGEWSGGLVLEHRGATITSRLLMEKVPGAPDAYSIPLARAEQLVLDPRWQTMP